jgi:arylsulfatase A
MSRLRGNTRLIFLAGFAVNTCINPGQAANSSKPNVIIILTDDQGSMDVNCYGARDLYTPNLDKLAKTGVMFTQFYSGSSICSPSRACLLTGKSPQSARLATNASCMYGDAGMPNNQVTIAEVFKKAGYSTAHIGKWHVGYSEETMPNAQGFDYSFGHMGGCIDNYSHFFYWGGANRHDLWENGKEVFEDGKFFSELMIQRASKFIKTNKKAPFFLYYAFNTPHYPLQPLKKWRDYYKNLPMPRRDYAAFISTTDEYIGRLIKIIDDEGIRNNTIIMYLSDQGHSCEDRTFGGGGYAGPYRGAKFSLFEGGIRIPAMISWPGNLPADRSVKEVCLSMDLLPTLAKLSGITDIPVDIEGQDISPVITSNASSQHKVIFWQLADQWAVRKGDWKLIGNPKDPANPNSINKERDKLFLVNLSADISESINLSDKEPTKLQEMIKEYLSWKFAKNEYVSQ